MLTRIFGHINSATSILVILYTIAVSAVYFYIDPIQNFLVKTALGNFMLHPIAGWLLFIGGLLVLVLVYQRQVQITYKLVKQHALFAFVMVPLHVLVCDYNPLAALIVSLCLLLVFSLWFAIYQGERELSNALNIGFLLGIGSLFSPAFTLLLPFTLLVYLVYGRLSLRTSIIPSIGYVTIWLNAFALDYLLADSFFVWNNFLNQFVAETTNWQMNKYVLVLFVAIIIPGLTEFAATLNRANVFKRLTFFLFILLLAVAASVYIFSSYALFPPVLLVPVVSAFFVNYLQYVKRPWFKEALMWLLLIAFVILISNWL